MLKEAAAPSSEDEKITKLNAHATDALTNAIETSLPWSGKHIASDMHIPLPRDRRYER